MTLYELKRAAEEVGRGAYIAPADAGCIWIRVNPPYKKLHVSIAMGSSIGIASGMVRAGLMEPIIAVIGDSALYHTGLPALVDAVWNDMDLLILICDNQTVAMTGRQPSPSSVKAEGSLRTVPLEDVVEGCGVRFVRVVDPYNVEESTAAIKKGIEYKGPAVVISRRPCILAEVVKEPYRVDKDKCNGCKICSHELGCTAIGWRTGKAFIEPMTCTGCGFCALICPMEAISQIK